MQTGETVVVVQTKYEPLVKWVRKVGPLMFMMWIRPADICLGLQLMGGGFLIHLWPVCFGIVHIERSVASCRESSTPTQSPQGEAE